MVLGLTRARPRFGFDGRGGLVMAPANDRATLSHDWLAERGANRFEASCDVSGGFPGFAHQGVALRSAQIRITDAYMLVDEGCSHGFGLPIQWLDGAAVMAPPGQVEDSLRVFYRDGSASRHFTIRMRAGLRSFWAIQRAARARDVLLDLGLPDRTEDHAPFVPNVTVPWEEAARFETEHVVWSGAVRAPVIIGERFAAADAWLTTRSMIWASGHGDGVNRIPLDAIQDVITGQADDKQVTPAVYLALVDPAAGRLRSRFDLPFVFDQYSLERNLRERGAFLVGLRSRGIALGLPAPLIQPWRIDVHRAGPLTLWPVAVPHRAPRNAASAESATARTRRCADLVRDVARRIPAQGRRSRLGQPVFHDAVARAKNNLDSGDAPAAERDVVLAEFSAPDGSSDQTWDHSASLEDYALASDWAATEVGFGNSAESSADPVEQVMPIATIAAGQVDAAVAAELQSSDLKQVRAYEAAALAALGEALQSARDRAAGKPPLPLVEPMPAPSLQAAAQSELLDWTAAGLLTMDESRLRRSRLIALVEAGSRLRSLIELYDAGHLTNDHLARKRDEISTAVSAMILAGAGLGE